MKELEEVKKEIKKRLNRYYAWTRKEGRTPYDRGVIAAFRAVLQLIDEKEVVND